MIALRCDPEFWRRKKNCAQLLPRCRRVSSTVFCNSAFHMWNVGLEGSFLLVGFESRVPVSYFEIRIDMDLQLLFSPVLLFVKFY